MRPFKFSLLACLAALLAAAAPARAADENAGTSAAQFLKLGAGARAAAMAEAQSAAASDIYSAYYNPAGLAALARPAMGAMHAQYVQGAGYQYGGLALPLGDKPGRTLAFTVANLGVTDMERRTQDTDLPVGYFEASNFAYALAYARAFSGFSAGLTAKAVRVSIDEVSGSAFALDAGLRCPREIGRLRVEFAAGARNLGTRLELGDGRDPLPSALVLGAAAEPYPGLQVALDLVNYRDADLVAALGAEYRRQLSGRLEGKFRAGYSNHRKDIEGFSAATFGAGLSVSSLDFDFAWVPFGDLGNTFRYSVQLAF